MHLMCIVGARPNFMKMAPILRELDGLSGIRTTLVHTGQHYDKNLSDIFFEDLQIRRPDVSLGVGSGTHAQQTAEVMKAIEALLIDLSKSESPIDRIVVVGDVNSTMAAALAAAKLHVSIAHVEAGLRSFDRTMPEEINRIVTDAISDLLLVSEPAGVENLLKEGHPPDRIHLVGNVMIDTLKSQIDRAKKQNILAELRLAPNQFGVVTLHRPSNVDDPKVLEGLLNVLSQTSREIPLVFPVHPRTRARIAEFGFQQFLDACPTIRWTEPLGYLDFLCLTSQAKVIVTDSGGLQEESTALGIPCLTMRENTERPITCEEGTSTLIGNSIELLAENLRRVLDDTYKSGYCPKLWDGQAAKRIAAILAK